MNNKKLNKFIIGKSSKNLLVKLFISFILKNFIILVNKLTFFSLYFIIVLNGLLKLLELLFI